MERIKSNLLPRHIEEIKEYALGPKKQVPQKEYIRIYNKAKETGIVNWCEAFRFKRYCTEHNIKNELKTLVRSFWNGKRKEQRRTNTDTARSVAQSLSAIKSNE